MSIKPPPPGRRTAERLAQLCLQLQDAPLGRPLPGTLVDRCAWWWPWLRRRRRAPWTTFRAALIVRLLEHAGAAPAPNARPQCWGHLNALAVLPHEGAWPWKLRCW